MCREFRSKRRWQKRAKSPASEGRPTMGIRISGLLLRVHTAPLSATCLPRISALIEQFETQLGHDG